MKKIVKITESQIKKIVWDILNEDIAEPLGGDETVSSAPFKVMSKDDILKLQTALSKTKFAPLLTKYSNVNNGVDGIFGKGTRTALANFQRENNIDGESGYMGPLTKNALIKVTKTPLSVTQPKPQVKTTTDTPKIKYKSYIIFDGKTLKFIQNGKVVKQWNAWSGRTKWNSVTPEQLFKATTYRNQDFMKVKDEGPIPEGQYTISSIQKRTKGNSLTLCGNKSWAELIKMYWGEYEKIGEKHEFNMGTMQDQIAWGNYRMPISAKQGTQTYGRGSFYLHGGGIPGSIGCIDLLDKIDEFVGIYKNYLSENGVRYLDLIVDYSGKYKDPAGSGILKMSKNAGSISYNDAKDISAPTGVNTSIQV